MGQGAMKGKLQSLKQIVMMTTMVTGIITNTITFWIYTSSWKKNLKS